ncbi:hypothetical protein A2331_00420 [Candidatus Falkowbacteria bacterium RIFOXYB2_FULL_34_18]|uniref:Steroid 5-alpha reductase C-terminal domain-containing protein n=1 Tax=Candidatus Falkowbacteria bacterium RIFOXYD2_FULL_34_120 TaxID=1798007 RepID=A0A1F5TN59_9BACT|nr:MAG: hypothetical protein A2331_00420 [Candidatus Falkowbacteria bacterium RIFOXYB2_FULL_34_18]OGF28512.1 MAG: hypothetical protein A2500_06645 [Candidatus Falkowbacteria bacterium RIFOXYC12_FULL_34_55]OGF38151.1 MAG: hypothetical protein A2466_00150 [Candidatus Falkowbacteria bacterium RIFOXYC2_FULL_34_220]OGF38530.1 MAG: hypothetical protein A2515_05080 [Candidatus Falkowbacteria bacterium RIFOXYD12_FULL_34_57]OGF40219.1 MAG: hypothetical protein A2531_04675 [Candidatus Falkowbacteria bact
MYFFLILGIIIFFGVRWFLFFKQKIFLKEKNVFDINSKNKKIFFLFIEIGGLFILLIQILFPKIFFIPWGNNFIIFGFILFLFGVVFSTWSRLFLGKNWNTAGGGGIIRKQELIIVGPYAICRHPIYLGTIFFYLGFEIMVSSWLLFVVCPALIAVVIIIAKKEECLLGQYFGKPYQEYRKKVSFLLFY